MNKNEEKKGISLIVLVITIIVIIILAVAVILSIANNNPIENAKEARDIHNQATLEEAANLEYTTLYSNKQITGTTFDTETIRENLKNQGFNEEEVKKVEITDKGVYVSKYLPTVPNGFTASQATGEKYITTGMVIYEGDPEVNDENVATARETRNQFVWIPVDDINEFKREAGYFKGEIMFFPEINYKEPYQNQGVNETEITEYNSIYESVKKYHGFYIARYEASKNNTTNKAQSVANQLPWNKIQWGNTMTDLSGGAVEVSRSLYLADRDGIKERDPVSTLCYGVQWDQTIRFLENRYTGIKKSGEGYGNYSGGIKMTGSIKEYAQNNIYDMCGNLFEWTMESYSNNKRVVRGGDYSVNAKNNPVSYRYEAVPTASPEMSGFRMALYIK